jgi:hypothetical protein
MIYLPGVGEVESAFGRHPGGEPRGGALEACVALLGEHDEYPQRVGEL